MKWIRMAWLAAFVLVAATSVAQRAARGRWKLSPMLREARIEDDDSREACVFVRAAGNADSLFSACGARELARFGDIYIVSVPLNKVDALAADRQVSRVEAGERCTLHMDSTAMHVGTLPVYHGEYLPQACTGRGVVVGVQDIGFDLTHPNFYSRDLGEYRISRLWDMLAERGAAGPDGDRYVGAEFTGREALLGYAHSRDGWVQTHGTHTLGIAAGSGYDTPYRGMAWESEVCLVANAVSSDIVFVDSLDYYKYTTATDALGFLYMLDYARSVGKPCVVSFSEGARQGFSEDDQLYDEVLEAMTGPGRIIVASAGNDGQNKSYVHKPRGRISAGTFILGRTDAYTMKMKADAPFTMRMVVYADGRSDTLLVASDRVMAADDEEGFADTLHTAVGDYVFEAVGYPSRFNPSEQAFELYLSTDHHFGGDLGAVSMEAVGEEADVEMYLGGGLFVDNDLNPALSDAECSHSIHAPASAPAVICVGANSYRTGVMNFRGEWFPFGLAKDGYVNEHSSVGPTYDGRIKPDVVAPGINIISSFSSFYRETYPDREYIDSDVAHFDYGGRTYAWNAQSGTSMATPVVAGAIALWLELVPDLTPQEVKDVLAATSRHPDEAMDYPNNYYGYGEIDVYKGLLEVLHRRGVSVSGLSKAQPREVHASVEGDEVILTFGAMLNEPVTVRVYSLSGSLLLMEHVAAGSAVCRLSLAGRPRGIYAVQVDAADRRFEGSTLVRTGR